jgi:cytochrome c556
VKRVLIYGAAAMLVAWSGAVTLAQTQKVTTPEELDKVMKKAGPAMRATGKALASGAWADVKTEVATLRQAVLDSQSFWIEHKKDDAVKFNKDTLAKIDAFEKLISATPVDAAGAGAALKDVGSSCTSCHKQYRVQDDDNNYSLKPGTIGQ